MNEELWLKAKARLLKEVDKFMDEQRQYMTSQAKDYENCSPDDFVTWFAEGLI